MTTNNQFLKQIAERVTDTEITGTHSDNYYWNLIATTVCNKTYAGVQCNGKYVKDIAEVICATTFSEHHFNNYYYRRMALECVSTLEHTNDNYLLGVIAENIVVPTILFDGIDLSLTEGKDILSYVDVTAQGNTEYAVVTAQLTKNGSSVSISGVPVVFGAYDSSDNLISGSEQSIDTDSNGQASYTYTSQGLGDVTIKAVPDNRILLIQTYSIQDCLKNIPTYSKTGTEFMQNVYTFDSVPTDIVIEADLSATNRQYRLVYSTTTNDTENRAIAFGVGGSDNRGLVINTGSGSTSVPYDTYTSYSTPFACKIVKNGNNVSMYIDDNLVGTYNVSAIASSLKYIHINSWSSSKTVTVTNLRIKPL